MPAKRGFVPEDLWHLRVVTDPQVSPDGSRVAFVVASPDKQIDKPATTIWVAPADGSSPGRAFSSGPADNSPRWSPDGRFLAFVAERGHGPQLHLASLDGGEAVALTETAHGVSQPVWSPDGSRLAFVTRTGDWVKPEDRSALERSAPRVITGLYCRLDGIGWFDARRSHIFVIPVEGGEPKQITEGDWDDLDPAWSPEGDSLAFVSDRSATRFDEVHRDVWVVHLSGHRRPRRLTRGRGTAASPRWSPDGSTIAYIGHEHRTGDFASNTHLLVVAVEDPKAPRSLSASLDRTVFGLMGAPGSTIAWTNNGAAVLFIAAESGTLAVYKSALGGPRPELVIGGDRQVTAMHLSGPTIAFSSQWPSRPSEISSTDADGGAERTISRAVGEIRALRWTPLRRTRHTAGDGRRIESFLLYPQGHAKTRPAPTVLDIHGGPHGWHPQVAMLGLYQALAAAGYVVVLPNPRGSQGYGEEFSAGCVGDWGGADFADLMSVLDGLVEDGVADPKRLYVTGYSYGGFMASWTVGHTDRFAAACVAAPITDLTSMWGTTDVPNVLMGELGGLPWERPEVYAERSPMSYVSKVTTPVQLLHWEGDLRCPITQTEQFFQALRKLGREVVLVRYPGGFHILQAPSQMVDYVSRHLDWFNSH
ncbi:MAG: S9 family peptidase [Acidimicrobiales bacterium]|jgi:dipeptidyl aminopeptidase/acylaminoacyl peptidase